MSKSKPEKRFKCGPISASVWTTNKTVKGQTVKFYSVRIDRAYRQNGTWEHTNSFNAEDLPKIALVANEAYRYICLQENEPQQQ